MKKVILVHGWGGSPENEWFPWLKKQLEEKGFKVDAPEMPDTFNPKIDKWVAKLNEIVGKPDKDTFLLGHSIGCQTVMRYLQSLEEETKIGGVIFVAGWFDLTDETWDEDYTPEKAKQWIETPIDFEKIKKHTDKFVDIASDDDPYVRLSDSELFKEKLGAKIIIEHNKGHICQESGVMELPSALNEILEMAK